MKGSEILARLPEDPGIIGIADWEDVVIGAVRSGSFVHEWREVECRSGAHSGKIRVSADALKLGEPDDCFRIMVNWRLAQAIAELIGKVPSVLMTPKVLDLVFEQADVGVFPCIQNPCRSSKKAMLEHDAELTARIGDRRGLVDNAGKIWGNSVRRKGLPDRAVNYGWYSGWHAAAAPYRSQTGYHALWQPVGIAHGVLHLDYSQFWRAMFGTMIVDGAEMSTLAVLANPVLCELLSAEGPLSLGKPTSLSDPARWTDSVGPARLLRFGMRGADVAAWQRLLGIEQTTVFDTATIAKTIDFQKEWSLVPDGVVGPKTMSVMNNGDPSPYVFPGVSVDPKKPMAKTTRINGYRFEQAKHYGYGPVAPGRRVQWVVLHTMELPEKVATAEDCARYFAASPDGRTVSAHYCVDSDSIVQCVREQDVAYAASSSNPNGIHVELAGYAKQSAEDWADPYSETELRLAAGLVAGICKRNSVTVRLLGVGDVLAGADGITTHAVITKAMAIVNSQKMTTHPLFGGHTTHTDPGPSFPAAAFVEMVAEVARSL